jgi:hypothetical protein
MLTPLRNCRHASRSRKSTNRARHDDIRCPATRRSRNWVSLGSRPARPAELVTVEQPKYRLTQMTTYELRDYRREMERAIASFDAKDPGPPARDQLQARLDAVLAEQEERKKIAHAG